MLCGSIPPRPTHKKITKKSLKIETNKMPKSNHPYITLENITISQARKRLKKLSGVSRIEGSHDGVRVYYSKPYYGLTQEIKKALSDTGAFIKGSHPKEPSVNSFSFRNKQQTWSTTIPKITIDFMCKTIADSKYYTRKDNGENPTAEYIKKITKDDNVLLTQMYDYALLPYLYLAKPFHAKYTKKEIVKI